MKKKKSSPKKPSHGSGLTIRKDSYSYTIKTIGEPDARVTIPYGNIEGLMYESDWNNHSLVRLHGCAPEGAELAVKSAFVAREKSLASPFHDETLHNCEEYALLRFWGEEGRSISQRFRDFATDIEEMEGVENWRPDLQSFTLRLAQSHRKKQVGKSKPKQVEGWLLDNWDCGKVACIFNSRQITEMLRNDGIEYDSKKLNEKIKSLGLRRAKRPVREKGYKAHFA